MIGILYREVTASTLVKITVDGKVLDPGSTGLGINQVFVIETFYKSISLQNERFLHFSFLFFKFKYDHPSHDQSCKSTSQFTVIYNEINDDSLLHG